MIGSRSTIGGGTRQKTDHFSTVKMGNPEDPCIVDQRKAQERKDGAPIEKNRLIIYTVKLILLIK